MEKRRIFFQISSRTPRVDTATVAVSDVSPHGLWRNVKYRSCQRVREMEMAREMEIVRKMIKSTVAQHHNALLNFW
jgi:hypothetical protein